jgi:hypothetical protein
LLCSLSLRYFQGMKKLRPTLLSLVCAFNLVGCAHPLVARHPASAPVSVAGTNRTKTTRTVIFVHGMFMTPSCWSEWMKRFEAQGFRVIAPPWPLHDQPAAVLRTAIPIPRSAS